METRLFSKQISSSLCFDYEYMWCANSKHKYIAWYRFDASMVSFKTACWIVTNTFSSNFPSSVGLKLPQSCFLYFAVADVVLAWFIRQVMLIFGIELEFTFAYVECRLDWWSSRCNVLLVSRLCQDYERGRRGNRDNEPSTTAWYDCVSTHRIITDEEAISWKMWRLEEEKN